MNDNEIILAVQTHYAAAARQGSSCCSPQAACCAPAAGPAQEIPLISQADLGLSCGLPTQFAALKPGETVLDLGSGAGVDVFRAALAVGAAGRVIGVDMTPEMIARAQELAQQHELANVEFRLGRIESLPVADESVDVVMSNCVINLALDKFQVFREIFRVLRPGGRLVISDIVSRGVVPEQLRQDPELWSCCLAGAVDQETYLHIIRQAGFPEPVIHQQMDYQSDPGAGYGFASLTIEGVKQ